MSQADIARRIGVAATVVRRWESGRHALLETTVERYAAALAAASGRTVTPRIDLDLSP